MRRIALDLTTLNAEQRSAVTAGDGPLLVLAGAGTGKTRVIVCRVAELIRRGVAPDRILGITFTNRAAGEMVARLTQMIPGLRPRPWLSTFHALGLRILRAEHKRCGLRARFAIYDESDTRGVLMESLRELAGVNAAETGFDVARRAISHWKSRFVMPEEAVDQSAGDGDFLRARAYVRYDERMQGLHAVDFDDLIFRPVRLLEQDRDAHAAWSQRFDHVLIDEYQDSNTAQYRFARLLAGERENLVVVGDDDQSIYAFRGAEVEKILSFRRDFPRARVVTLEANYRSVATILAAANAVIRHNPRRHDKKLRAMRGGGAPIPLVTLADEDAEAAEVVSRVLRRTRAGGTLGQQAILLRSAIQARPFEEKLRLHRVRYTLIGARSFYDRKEVRDLLAYLRLLVAPEDDIALLRILNVPRRGWGKESRERLDSWARESRVPLVTALERMAEIPALAAPARAGGEALAGALARGRAALAAGTAADLAAAALLKDIQFDNSLRESAEDAEDLEFRRRSIGAVLESLGRHTRGAGGRDEDIDPRAAGSRSPKSGADVLSDFLTAITLDVADENDDADSKRNDTLTLITFHGAKGLEFDCVYVAGVEDDLIPHRRALAEGGDFALEEERRLFYVALTRAKDELVLTRAAIRRRFGREVETTESRYLAEIPAELLDRVDLSHMKNAPVDADTRDAYLAQIRSRFTR